MTPRGETDAPRSMAAEISHSYSPPHIWIAEIPEMEADDPPLGTPVGVSGISHPQKIDAYTLFPNGSLFPIIWGDYFP